MTVVALAAAIAAGAQTPFTALHPEAAHPDPSPQVSQDPYSDLVMRMQERLNALGFDAGPPNGAFETKTQAALAQFQLSRAIPASGQLDDQTLAELGVERLVESARAQSPQIESPPAEAPQGEASAGR